MLRRTSYFVAIFVLVVVLYACNNNSSREEPIMYKQSELAVLMRNMYDSLDVWKTKIEENDSAIIIFPQSFLDIHTAEATTPKQINETFHNMADAYLAGIKQNTGPDNWLSDKEFNVIVNSCVACHQKFCQGPIPKIKTLNIPE